MEKYRLLLNASFKKQKNGMIGILILLFILSLCLFSSVALFVSGERSVSSEMDRLGFGDFTAWVNDNAETLQTEIVALPEVESVRIQPLIFSGYEAGGRYSDNEGQLIVYDGAVPYRFISGDGKEIAVPKMQEGTVYISPALRSSFDVAIGDTIQFELSRSNGVKSLTVAGYFEDAFMGSSMIDMKSFLISETDRADMLATIAAAADYDVLASGGAVMHVRANADSRLTEAELQKLVYKSTSLSRNTEFAYSRTSILRYMLLLQNILAGFLIAFSAVLLVISLIVIGHSLSGVIEQNQRDMAILKTIGLSGNGIRRVYLTLYGGTAATGILIGLALSLPLAQGLSKGMLTSTGMVVPVTLPAGTCAFFLLALLLAFGVFLYLRTKKILRIAPVQAMREAASGKAVKSTLHKEALPFFIALRELLSGKRKYIAMCLISAVLVVFLSVIGKMGAWLGPNGEGLMNAFSVADHDLGVQPFNQTVDMAEIERVINWYSPVRETYALAMESITLNGQEYTANVLDKTAYFHMLRGTVCGENEVLITDTVANEQGLKLGDTVEIAHGGRSAVYTVSGIYQCANGMGSNIGMSRGGYAKIGDVNGYNWCYHYILVNGGVREFAMQYLQDSYRGIDVHTNSWSGLSGIVAVMHALIAVIYVIAAVFILVSVSLTASKLLQSETGNLAIYKSMGLPSSALRLSFALRFLLTVAVGALLGALLSAAFADTVIGAVFRMFGIGAFDSRISLGGTILPPLAVIALFFGFSWLYSARIGKISLVQLISENND
ncbi:MAG: FtsX-like permease family protein [Eubacteriales bacterium]|nr:FtsX-like permease family protein [Eubacteriales bacterium]